MYVREKLPQAHRLGGSGQKLSPTLAFVGFLPNLQQESCADLPPFRHQARRSRRGGHTGRYAPAPGWSDQFIAREVVSRWNVIQAHTQSTAATAASSSSAFPSKGLNVTNLLDE